MSKYVLISIGTVLALGLLLLTFALLTFDDEDYQKLVLWSVERFSGYRMLVDGQFIVDLSKEPSLTASGIRFEAPEGSPDPFLTSIGHLDVKIALGSILSRTVFIKKLQIEDVILNGTLALEGTGTRSWLDIILPDIHPVFENAEIKNIKLNTKSSDSDQALQFSLNQLIIDDFQDNGSIRVNGDGTINTRGFQIEGRLGSQAGLTSGRQPHPLDFKVTMADLTLTISGSIADYMGGKGLNLQFGIDDQNVDNLLESFNLEMPSLGRLTLAATLTGDAAEPRLSDLDLQLSDDSSIQFTAKGGIDNLASGKGAEIKLSGESTNEAILNLIFPEDWRVDDVKFDGVLHHSTNGYRIEGIKTLIDNIQDVTFEIRGWIQLGDIDSIGSVKEVDLNLHLKSLKTEAMRPLLTNSLPEIGSVDAKGRLVGPVERLALEDILIIRGGSGSVRVETRGRIGWIPFDDDKPLTDMHLDFDIKAKQSSILSTFYGVPIKEIGTVSISSQVRGSSNRFQLENIKFHSIDNQGLESMMDGRIHFAEQANGNMLGDVYFKLKILAPSMGAGEPLLGANIVPTLGPVKAEAEVIGTTDVLSIENIDISAGKPGKVLVKWWGRVGKFPLGSDLPVSEVETYGSMQAKKFSDFIALFGYEVPDLGPVSASWKDVDRDGIYGIESFKFETGDGKNFLLDAKGRVDSIFRYDKLFIDGVALKLSVRAADTDNIAKLLGLEFPDLGSVNGGMALKGGEGKIRAEDFHMTVNSAQGLEIVAKGGVGHIGLQHDIPVKDIDIRLTANAPNIAAVPMFSDAKLPDLGALQASAKIAGGDDALNIETFDIRAGTGDDTFLEVNGNVNHIRDRDKIKLKADFNIDSKAWLKKVSDGSIPEIPQLNGSVEIAGAADHVRIDAFHMSTAEVGGLSVDATGKVKPEADYSELDIQLKSVMKDPAAWGRLMDLSMPNMSSLTFDGNYTNRDRRHKFQGETVLGKTRLQTNLSRMIDGPRPYTEVKLSSDIVYLEDLGLKPMEKEKQTAASDSAKTEKTSKKSAARTPEKTKKPPDKPIFDDRPLPLQGLKSHDFLLDFQADKVAGKDVALDRINLNAALKEERLVIKIAEMGYQHGQLTGEGVIDAAVEEPEFKIKIVAEDVDIDDVLSYMDKSEAVEGQLNLVLDLHSRGKTRRELAANLNGEFGFAVENGRIKRGVELIAADALDLLFTAPAKETYTNLNCMACRLGFENGVGTVKVLYMDTPSVRARGGGKIDLNSESIDILIRPKAKRRLFKKSSPVRVKGTLRNPSTMKVPANEAAILAAQLAIPIVALPGRALGILLSLVKEDKDENSPCLEENVQKAEE